MPSQLLFVDLDGDGLEELVGNRVLYRDGYGSMGIYTRPDGEWVFLPQALEFDNPSDVRRTDAQAMTAADVNGDGLLDLFVAGYETDQSRDAQRFNRVDAHDGADNLLFITRATFGSRKHPTHWGSRGRSTPTSRSSSISTATVTSTWRS